MYGGRSNYRDNFGRWQKTVTSNLTKGLIKQAENAQIDIAKVVADKLEEVHKANVIASYYPRAKGEQEKAEYNKTKKAEETTDKEQYGINHRLSRKKLSYQHTGILENAIYTTIEKKSRYQVKAIVKIRPDIYPEDHPRADGPITATKVYEWLREGTRGGSTYWFTNKKGETPNAHNYSTPAHLFELHTKLQMEGFLDTLDIKKYIKSRRYRVK